MISDVDMEVCRNRLTFKKDKIDYNCANQKLYNQKDLTMKKIDAVELKELLNNTAQKIKSTNDNIETNMIVENLIISVMDSEFASLWLFDESNALLLRERDSTYVREISMLGQQGVLAKCFLTLSGGIYNYLASEKEYLPSTDNPDDIRMKSKIIVPLIDDDRLVGIVTAYSSILKIKNFDEDDMELLESMSSFLVNVIYRMRPEMHSGDFKRVIIGERLMEASSDIVEKVEEIQQVQQSAEAADETMSFLSNTVHDIRTPANTLYGFLELLEDQLDNPRLLQYVHNAKESAQFINDLTTSILDRVSSQRERTKAKPVQISTAKFFANIAESFSANMFNKGIAFNVYIDPLIAKEIVIEDIMLKRVIMNLIGNAHKFTPSKKTIDFSVQYSADEKRLHISIKDTGIGIPKDRQQGIFDAFVQAEDDTSAKYGGTGLGLAISSQYVKELGGELKLQSKLDTGSVFYFDIPVEVSDSKEAFKPVKNSQIEIGILLNNDNIFSGKNISRYLQRMGIDKEKISPVKAIKNLPGETTHLVCYQHQLNDEVITFAQKKTIELLVVEELFLSLLDTEVDTRFSVISQYGYYANILHAFISNRVATKVLVVDDDQINVQLLRAILEEEFCHIEAATDGEAALSMLKEAIKEEEPYSLLYLDEYMPKLTGTEVIERFRAFEKKKDSDPIFAVSITGDGITEEQKSKHFNTYVGKPFNKKAIKETLQQSRSSQ